MLDTIREPVRLEGAEPKAGVPGTGGAGTNAWGAPDGGRPATMRELLPYFVNHCTHVRGFSPATVESYRHDVSWVVRTVGDIAPGELRKEHVLVLQSRFAERNVGPARIRRLLNGLKCFLKFCQQELDVETLDLSKIRGPRLPRREVVFLTPEEMRQFLGAIPVYEEKDGRRVLNLRWLCFRVIVEILRGTGMRISEALSLRRSSLDVARGEVMIIGKGNKERKVFFSPSALGWVKEYLNRRRDSGDRICAWPDGRPVTVKAVQHRFKKVRDRSGITKRVSAHVFRHTFATTLLMNGAPIGLIKELLGHDLLETTCKFYLGVDKRLAKGALHQYLNYDYDEGLDGGSRGPVGGRDRGAPGPAGRAREWTAERLGEFLETEKRESSSRRNCQCMTSATHDTGPDVSSGWD